MLDGPSFILTRDFPLLLFMTVRLSSVIGWICIGLVAAFFLFSAVMKFMPVEGNADAIAMQQSLGITGFVQGLGVLQLIIFVLYVWPRTSTVGFVLMVGYMGGVLATNLTHGFTQMEALPIYVTFAVMTLGAYLMNPELTKRLRTGKA